MDSIEKTVIIVSFIMAAGAVAFVIYPNVSVSILEPSTSEQIENGMPSQYSKVVDITVDRKLENQPNVSEEAEIRTSINTEEEVSRSEVIERLIIGENTAKENKRVRYTDGDINRSYLYAPRQVVNNSDLPVINRPQLNGFNKSEQFVTVGLSSETTEFTGLLGVNFQKYTTAENINSVDYSVSYHSETGRLESYKVTATSDREDITIEATYIYDQPLITSREPTVEGNQISYNAESEVITMNSVTENKTANINSQDGELELLKGEDIRSYVLFELVNVSNNSGNAMREHLITDEKVIISDT